MCIDQRIEHSDWYRDFEYDVVGYYPIGHRCGYVRIPPGHRFYKYDARGDSGLKIHGGVTFAGIRSEEEPDEWWIGFDCTHPYDALDPELMSEEMLSSVSRSLIRPTTEMILRDTDFVRDQCKKLIDQITDKWTLWTKIKKRLRGLPKALLEFVIDR